MFQKTHIFEIRSAQTEPLAHVSTDPEEVTAGLPAEVQGGDRTVAILALMMFLAPAVGSTEQTLVQDTLKSIVVSFAALSAAFLFFLYQRHRTDGLRWHALMWLPLGLTTYALGSMVWAHTYLGGVEAIRWFVFSLLLWLGLNTLSRERAPWLLEAIHWGAVVASIWAALQFWFDFSFFVQGAMPSSTFVNRNFFAEFVVCTLPFSAYLLAQSRTSSQVALLAFTLGLNIVALMMTGTRSALSALWLLMLVLPLMAVLYRQHCALSKWDSRKRWMACGVLLATVGVLGQLSTSNPKILADSGGFGASAFDRAFKRTASITVGDTSLNMRFSMWASTARMIKAHPVTGIGAGAWEVMVPLYQTNDQDLEADFYAHNEVMQLLAEYGLVGAAFLLCLLSYLLFAAWSTWRNRTAEALAEAPMRSVSLASMLAFLMVSNAGFPWRLAATGGLFALNLALLAASDARLQNPGPWRAVRLAWKPVYGQALAAMMLVCLALCIYISRQAFTAEQKIVTALKIAVIVTASGDPNNPKWEPIKRDMLTLVKEGIEINPHYRKITPTISDHLARWGDWQDAVWIWESVTSSRPYVPGLMLNIARGYARMGNETKAFEYLARCDSMYPRSGSVRALKLELYSHFGQQTLAVRLAKQFLAEGPYNPNLLNSAYFLGARSKDADLIIQSLEVRQKNVPGMAADTLLKFADVYANLKQDDARALAYYQSALAAAPVGSKDNIRHQIPKAYASRL